MNTTELADAVAPEMPKEARSQLESLRKMSEEKLIGFIRDRINGIRDSMIALSAAVFVAEERGFNLSELFSPTSLRMLRRIAFGQVSADLVSRFEMSEKRYRLTMLSALPMPDQDRVAKGERFDVLVGDGQIVKLQVEQMTNDQFVAIFSDGRVKTPIEQEANMKGKLLNAQFSAKKPAFHADKENRQLIVNRPVILSKRDLEQALAEISR